MTDQPEACPIPAERQRDRLGRFHRHRWQYSSSLLRACHQRTTEIGVTCYGCGETQTAAIPGRFKCEVAIDDLHSQVAALAAALKAIEWNWQVVEGTDETPVGPIPRVVDHCPWCGLSRRAGHAADCIIRIALANLPAEAARKAQAHDEMKVLLKEAQRIIRHAPPGGVFDGELETWFRLTRAALAERRE